LEKGEGSSYFQVLMGMQIIASYCTLLFSIVDQRSCWKSRLAMTEARISELHKLKKRKILRDMACPEFCSDAGKVCSSNFP
jgi:hypothetical protein